jgi:hypothetical protein
MSVEASDGNGVRPVGKKRPRQGTITAMQSQTVWCTLEGNIELMPKKEVLDFNRRRDLNRLKTIVSSRWRDGAGRPSSGRFSVHLGFCCVPLLGLARHSNAAPLRHRTGRSQRCSPDHGRRQRCSASCSVAIHPGGDHVRFRAISEETGAGALFLRERQALSGRLP